MNRSLALNIREANSAIIAITDLAERLLISRKG